jgi:hypothetical protein
VCHIFVAVHQNGACRSGNGTGEDFDQGGFAGSVFPDKAVNGVLVDIEADIIDRPNTRELFGKVFNFQQNSAHGFAPRFDRLQGRKPSSGFLPRKDISGVNLDSN